MANPAGLSYVKAVGQYQMFTADGIDDDDLPDFVALEGTGVITPNLIEAKNLNPGLTSVYLPEKILITVENGWVTRNNQPYVMLLAPSEGVTPVFWNYQVKLSLRPLGSTGPYVDYGPFNFDPIPDPDSGVVDLAAATPVDPAALVPMTAGPPGRKGDTGPIDFLSIGTVDTEPGADRPAEYNILNYGAVADGVTDCAPAINAAILDAHNAGGGDVIVPPGAYTVYSQIGNNLAYMRHVRLRGLVPRGVRWNFGDGALDPNGKPWVAAAHIRAANNTPIIGGMWENCEILYLALDADMRGSACVKAHLSKTRVAWCELLGWSGYGMLLNNGDLTDDLGFLNRIEYNNISDTGEEVGVGLQLEYRFIDSWIENNNIEAYGPDIQINSGGPFRILKNHLNGNRSPQHNILINGGVRECLIDGNILEGSREEAVKYIAPGWLTSPERTSLQINNNIVRQCCQAGGKPVIGIYGNTGNAAFYMQGLTVVGNTMSSDYNPTYAVELNKVQDASIGLNYWRFGHKTTEPVRALSSTGVEVIGNHGDNAIKTT